MDITIKITITGSAVFAFFTVLWKIIAVIRKRYYLNDVELISLCKKSRNRTLTPKKREEILDKISARLGKGVNVNSLDGKERTALIIASAGGNDNLNLVELLLDKQPRYFRWLRRIDAQDRRGNTALILASRFGSYKIVKALLDAGANVNAKNGKGWTALRRAEKHGYSETARILREHGAHL